MTEVNTIATATDTFHAKILAQIENLKALAEREMTPEIATQGQLIADVIGEAFEEIASAKLAEPAPTANAPEIEDDEEEREMPLTYEDFATSYEEFRKGIRLLLADDNNDPDDETLEEWMSIAGNVEFHAGRMYEYANQEHPWNRVEDKHGNLIGGIFYTLRGKSYFVHHEPRERHREQA